MTRIMAIVSQKGGVGKTSLAQNLGAELAAQGQLTLLVDLDPQSNLTTGWGVDPYQPRLTTYDAMTDPEQSVQTMLELRPNLYLMPANLDLAGAELAFINAIDRNTKLRKALAPIAHHFDIILLDGPPSLGFFTVNALAAATEILIPLQVHPYAYKALDQLMGIVDQVGEINPSLRLSGIVMTMYDQRNSLTSAIEDAARQRFPDVVFDTVIHRNTKLGEAPSYGESIINYDVNSRGASNYLSLAKEVIDKNRD